MQKNFKQIPFSHKSDFLLRILKLASIFTLSSIWLYYLVITLPPNSSNTKITFPKSFSQLHDLSELLKNYSQSHFYLVLLLFCSAYLYKQAFAIPGSVFLNILSGALYGPIYGTLITSIFSAIGASCCYLFSKHIFGVLITFYFNDTVTKIKSTINKQKQNGSLFNVLLSLRFFPCSPNWLMNMSAPLCGVPIKVFSLSVGVGLVPYNYICAQAGDVVSSIESVDQLLTFNVLVSFVFMAFVALVPVIYKRSREQQK